MVANFDNQFECVKARGIQNRIALHKQKCLDQAKITKRAEKKNNEIARAEYIKRRSLGKTQKSYDSYLTMANPNHEFETLKKSKVVKQAEEALDESFEAECSDSEEESHVVFVKEEASKTAEPKVEQKTEEAEWELL
jgi:hypothetical protein